MTIEQDSQYILDKALGTWVELGYHLREDDDHFLVIYRQDERVAVFSQLGVSTMELQETCRRHHDDGHRCRHSPCAACNVPENICEQIKCQARFSK